MSQMCDITGENVRKCEKGEGLRGENPKRVISYWNSPLNDTKRIVLFVW